jgi:hypothetical protein
MVDSVKIVSHAAAARDVVERRKLLGLSPYTAS